MTTETRRWSHGGPGLPTLTCELRLRGEGDLWGGELRQTMADATGRVLRRWRHTLDDDQPLAAVNDEPMAAWRAECRAHLAGRSTTDELAAWRRATTTADARRAHRTAGALRRSTCLRRAVETTTACARRTATARSTCLPVRPVRRSLRRAPRAPDPKDQTAPLADRTNRAVSDAERRTNA